MLPKLLLLILFTTFPVQMGMMLVLVPGVLLAIVLAFAPIMLVQDKMGILGAMRSSMLRGPICGWWRRLLSVGWWRNPAVTVCFQLCRPDAKRRRGGDYTISNLISALLLIYLFRVYAYPQLILTRPGLSPSVLKDGSMYEAVSGFLPLVVFFAFYKLYDIYAATTALIVATAVVLITAGCATGKWKMALITFVLVAVFGGLTIFFHNDEFIKWKVTVIYALFAGALLFSQWVMKSR